MANRIMQWLLTLALPPPSSRSRHLSLGDMGRAASGRFLSGPGCVCWTLGDRSGWRGIVGGRRANSCEVSRMAGQGARKRSVAGCQGWEHTEPCLKPGRAPSTGAERGWVKGYKNKGGWDNQEKKAHLEEQIVQTIIIRCLCWTESCLPL